MRYFLTAWNTLKLCAVAALPVFLLFQVATAQSKNSFQEFQPGGSNYVARSTGYTYGWPACGSCEEEPDVVLQFILDESSGSIFDEVSSFELVPTGSINYGQEASGLWSELSPGISLNSTTSRFYGGLTSAYDLGDGEDFVLEAAMTVPVSERNYQMLFSTGGPTFATPGFTVQNANAGASGRIEFRDDAGSVNLYAGINLDKDYRDGDMHKWRWIGTIGGELELFVDSVSQGTFDLSSLSGKTIGSYFMYLLGWGNATWYSDAELHELRLTIGNKTNCSNSGGDC